MTYSIVARDPQTGDLGAAVQSHWFAAGIVCWARAGVGAVATQALAELSYGPLGLDAMRGGASAEEALARLKGADADREVRQVAMVDRQGRVAVHTGADCMRECGHRTGAAFSCQANMMRRATVWDAMHDAFEAAEGDLADRLLIALEAAEAEGGDVRGKQAARLLVVRAEPSGKPWEDVLVDLRVDDHPEPLPELRRLLALKRAYDRLERAEELELANDLDGAFAERRIALEAFPESPEIAFWTALSLAVHGRLDEARQVIQVSYDDDPGWADLLRRLEEQDLFGVTPGIAAALLGA